MKRYLTSAFASYILSIVMVGGLYFSLPEYSCAGWLDDAKEKASELKEKAGHKAREKADQLRRQAAEKAAELRRRANEKASELSSQAKEKAMKLKADAERKAADAARQLRRDVERKKKEWEVEEKVEKAKAHLDKQAQKSAKAVGEEMYKSHRSFDKAKEAWGDPKTPKQRRAAFKRAKDAFMKEHKISNEDHFEMLFNKHVDENWAKASRENRRVMKAIALENEKKAHKTLKKEHPQVKIPHKKRPWKDDTKTRQADRVLEKFVNVIESVCSWCGKTISNAYYYVIGFFSSKDYVEYTVKRGDSLSGIAKDKTSNWRNWQEIMRYNKKYNSKGFDEHLDIGEKVYIPKDMLRK